MTEFEFEVLWNTEESYKFQECGMDFGVNDLTTKLVTIYNIDAIQPNDVFAEANFTTIFAGGEIFIATKSYKEIKKIISEKLK
jgi:hypothetical protein